MKNKVKEVIGNLLNSRMMTVHSAPKGGFWPNDVIVYRNRFQRIIYNPRYATYSEMIKYYNKVGYDKDLNINTFILNCTFPSISHFYNKKGELIRGFYKRSIRFSEKITEQHPLITKYN